MSLKTKEYSSRQISKDLGLSSFISNRAPISKDNKLIFEIENKLKSYAQVESSKIRDKYREVLEKVSNDKQNQLNSINNIKDEVKSLTLTSFNDLKNQLPPESEKTNLEKQADDATKLRVNFLTRNKLNSPPATPHPDFKWIYILVPFLCLIIEAFINGKFLGEQTLNPAIQQVLAFTIASVNCMIGFLVGKYLWPKLNIRKHNNLKKTPIILTILLSVFIVFSVNTLFAHYRQAVVDANQNEKVYKSFDKEGITLTPEILKSQVGNNLKYVKDGKTLNLWPDYSPIRRDDKDRLWSESTTLFGYEGEFKFSKFMDVGDIQSVLLLLIGVLFFAIALIDFYLFAGEYPGYAKVLDDCDQPNKDLNRMSKKAQEIKLKFSKKYQSDINKYKKIYQSNLDNYTKSWNDIEYFLTSFVNEAKSLNEAIQSSMDEFVSDFYNSCPPEVQRIDSPRLNLNIALNGEGESWDKAFVASKNHFQFLRELWVMDDNNNPLRFINKQNKLEEFQSESSIFNDSIEKQQALISEDKHLNTLINFNLKKKRELYLVG